MKHNFFKKSLVCLLMLAAVLAALPAMAAEGGTAATGYVVTNNAGAAISRFTQGNLVDITVSLKNPSLTAETASAGSIDASRLVDSFSGGTVTTEVTSSGSAPLTYNVKLAGVKYSGSGGSLKLLVGVKGDAASYETIELSISEAVEYEAPKAEDSYVPSTPEAAPAPMIIISRSDIAKPVEPGQELELTLYFQNLAKTKLTSPVVTVSPSEGLSLSGGASSFTMADIGGFSTGSIKIKIKAASVIASPSQSLGVELKFNYFNNVSYVQGSAEDKVSVPALGRESVPQPVVLVTRSPISKPLSAGESADVTVTFKNAGSARLGTPAAYVTASESLIVMNEVSTFLLPDIDPGKSESITVKVKAAKEITSTNQSLNVELKYSYDSGGTLTQATASDRVNISANATTSSDASKTDAPVPNLIISSFEYGGESVAAGRRFTLDFSFENTGKLKVENIVVTVDGGESFTMDDSTNTFFYSSLAAGGVQSQQVSMQALSSAKSGAQSVGVSFKYEYVDGQKRASSSADIKISIPMFQPDRFQVNAPAFPDIATVGEELALSLSYVNKGKGDISNVEASVEGQNVDSPARTQYLGNISAGASGSIGFALTPNTAGEVDVTLKITYEDADQKLQTKEFPITLNAQEPVLSEELPLEGAGEEAPQKSRLWLWIAIAAAAAAVVITLVSIKKKVSAAGSEAVGAQWDDWDDDGGSGGSHREE